MKNNFLIGGIAMLALILGVFAVFAPRGVQQVTLEPVAGGSGLSFPGGKVYLAEGYTDGGKLLATTSNGAGLTYSAGNIVNSKIIEHNASVAVTATLPTEALLSSAGFLPNVGDIETRYIHASTSIITLAGGTGTTLKSASSTLAIIPDSTARLDFVRQGATEGRDIWVLMTTANK